MCVHVCLIQCTCSSVELGGYSPFFIFLNLDSPHSLSSFRRTWKTNGIILSAPARSDGHLLSFRLGGCLKTRTFVRCYVKRVMLASLL